MQESNELGYQKEIIALREKNLQLRIEKFISALTAAYPDFDLQPTGELKPKAKAEVSKPAVKKEGK